MLRDSQYKWPLGIAIAAHLLLIIYLIVHVAFSTTYTPAPGHDTKIVNAVMVNQQQIDQEVLRLKNAQREKELQKQQEVAEQKKQIQEMQKQREQEQARVKQLKEAQEKIKQQQILQQKQEQAKLAAIKEQQKKAQQKVEQIKQQAAEKAKQEKIAATKAKENNKPKSKDKVKSTTAKTETTEKKATDKKAVAKQDDDSEELLQQQLDDEQNQLSSTRASYMQGVIDKYKGLIVGAIERQWLIPDQVSKDLSCELLIRLQPGGGVISVSLVKGSGSAALDQSAIAAVYKASPLPIPEDSKMFDSFRELDLIVKPENVING